MKLPKTFIGDLCKKYNITDFENIQSFSINTNTQRTAQKICFLMLFYKIKFYFNNK